MYASLCPIEGLQWIIDGSASCLVNEYFTFLQGKKMKSSFTIPLIDPVLWKQKEIGFLYWPLGKEKIKFPSIKLKTKLPWIPDTSHNGKQETPLSVMVAEATFPEAESLTVSALRVVFLFPFYRGSCAHSPAWASFP